ncbi:g9294 [Coccomyxa viridis]|uniref:G9294 protein n=1 Tax=Coccomyxa viridis TaxID=1274662 RepID=A0ABP1G2L3_9CHLO
MDAQGNLIFVSSDTTFKLTPPSMLIDLPALRTRLLADRSEAMHRLQTLFCGAASVTALTGKSRKDLLAALEDVSKIDERLDGVQRELGLSSVAGQESVDRLQARSSVLMKELSELKSDGSDAQSEDTTRQYIKLNRELLDTSQALTIAKESEVTDTRFMEAEPCHIAYKGVSAKAIRVNFI